MKIADEWPKKSAILKVEKSIQLFKLVSALCKDECANMNVRKKVKHHHYLHLRNEIIKTKINVNSDVIAWIRCKISNNFRKKLKRLIKLCHRITKFESMNNKYPNCTRRMDYSHMYSCLIPSENKN